MGDVSTKGTFTRNLEHLQGPPEGPIQLRGHYFTQQTVPAGSAVLSATFLKICICNPDCLLLTVPVPLHNMVLEKEAYEPWTMWHCCCTVAHKKDEWQKKYFNKSVDQCVTAMLAKSISSSSLSEIIFKTGGLWEFCERLLSRLRSHS